MKNLIKDISVIGEASQKDYEDAINSNFLDTKNKALKKAHSLKNDPADPNVHVRGFGVIRKSQAEKLKMNYEEYESLIEGVAHDNPVSTFGMKGKSAQDMAGSMQRGPTTQEMIKAQKHVEKEHDPGHKMVGVTVGLDGKTQVKSAITQTSVVGEPVKKSAVKEEIEQKWGEGADDPISEESYRTNFQHYDSWKKEVEKRGYKLTHSATQVTAHDDKTKKQMGVFRHSTYGSAGHLLNEAKWVTPKPSPISDAKKGETVGVAVNNYQLKFGKVHHVGEKMIHITHRNGETVAYPHNKVFRDVEDAWPQSKKVNEAVETKLQMTMPLFIRLLEWAKEECKDDVEIHQVAEKIAAVNGIADMDVYASLLEEIQLDEMGDTSKGKQVLASYIKKRSQEVASDAAYDGLSAGNNLNKHNKTVYGLDPETKQPIYDKPKPKFKEGKKLIGIKRAVDRLVK